MTKKKTSKSAASKKTTRKKAPAPTPAPPAPAPPAPEAAPGLDPDLKLLRAKKVVYLNVPNGVALFVGSGAGVFIPGSQVQDGTLVAQ